MSEEQSFPSEKELLGRTWIEIVTEVEKIKGWHRAAWGTDALLIEGLKKKF